MIPLGAGSDWDCFKITYYKKFGAGTSPFNDSQISMTEDCLYLKPQGIDIMTEYYSEVLNNLKIAGMPIPSNDIWIAAVAFQKEFKLSVRNAIDCTSA